MRRFIPYWIVVAATLFTVSSLGVTGWAYLAVGIGLILSCISGQYSEYCRIYSEKKEVNDKAR